MDQISRLQSQFDIFRIEYENTKAELKSLRSEVDDLKEATIPIVEWELRLGKANFMKQLGLALARELGGGKPGEAGGKKIKGEKKMREFLEKLEKDFSTQTLKEFFSSLDPQRLRQTSLPSKYWPLVKEDFAAVIEDRNMAAHMTEGEFACLVLHPQATIAEPLYKDL